MKDGTNYKQYDIAYLSDSTIKLSFYCLKYFMQ